MTEEKDIIKDLVNPPESKTGTVLGLNERIEAALCYILGFITGLAFLIVEKENKFIRFHAIQSIVTSVTIFVVIMAIERVISMTPLFGWILALLVSPVVWLLSLLLWIFLIYRASQGDKIKLPIIGKLAEKYAQ